MEGDLSAPDGGRVPRFYGAGTREFLHPLRGCNQARSRHAGRPTLLVGQSYGGSIVTEAGVYPSVVGLVNVAAHAPDVGEDEGSIGKKTPSVLAKTPGAIKETPDGYTYLDPEQFPKLFVPDLPREQALFGAHSRVLASAEVFTPPLMATAWKTKLSRVIVAANDTIIKPDLERRYYKYAKSQWQRHSPGGYLENV
ncbi:alpha/beta hydrolase [Rhizobium tubonense]|uniref:alpha/beta hydrolase n=1 Tax=Rhizobium tubonense TaxID=484088 RepID=UPI001FCE68D0|nr:alpha/beta hydrolase [Rhizobium tubonense]